MKQHSPGRIWRSPLEARACLGLLQSYCGEHDAAEQELTEAATSARAFGAKRVEAIVLGSLAVALQRADKLNEARRAFEETLEAAEAAGDAGSVANTRLKPRSAGKHRRRSGRCQPALGGSNRHGPSSGPRIDPPTGVVESGTPRHLPGTLCASSLESRIVARSTGSAFSKPPCPAHWAGGRVGSQNGKRSTSC